MRYLGGTLGGTWLTALAGDLGNGIFDGANLVANFESLNPANTYWEKPYGLYSKVDTEAAALPRFRDLVGQPGAAQCRRDAVDRRQPLRRQQAHLGRDPHVRRRARRPAQHPLADHRAVLVGRQHHAAAAGAGLDHRSLRARRRDRRQRPDHRLHAAPDDRPSRHLRLGQGGDQGACRVRLVHGDDRPAAARPVRGGDHRSRRRYRPCRPDPRQVPVPSGSPHARRHPRARRQQRGRQQALRRRGARLRGQSRALPHVRPAGRAGPVQQPERRPDAATASQPAALRRLFRPQSRDATGEGAGRRGSRRPQAGVAPTIPCS